MKRILAMILSAMLLLSMTACTGADLLSGKDETYVPSADVAIAVTHIGDKAKVVTRRTSDRELSGVELVCVYFDAQGIQLGQYEHVECTFSNQEKLNIWSFEAPVGCVHMDVAVAAVTYADGTKHPCPGVSAWAEETAKAFTPENYETQAAAAEKCDAVEYSVEAADGGELSLKLKNISGKEISEVIACLLWFDEAGAPVDVDGLLVDNSERVSAKNPTPDEEAAYTVDTPDNGADAKVIIQEVTFADGSVWENDYVYEWSVANWETAK